MAEPIGEIPVVISGDYSDLQKALDDAVKKSQDGAEKISDAFYKSFAGSSEAFDDFVKSMGGFSSTADTLIAKQKELDVELIKAKGALVEIQLAYEAGAVSINTLVRAQGEVAAAAQRANVAFQESTQQTKAWGESFKQWVEHPVDSAKDALISFAEKLGPLGVAGVAAAAGLAVLGKQIIDLVLDVGEATESMNNLAARLNLSFQDTKKLSEMADIAGVSIESLSRVSMRLADALEDPAGAGKKVGIALHDMGVFATDSGDALKQLLEKLAAIPDATERISKAHEIMGRSAVQLEPLLRDYAALSQAVEDLGGQLDETMVKRLLDADDAADKLGIAWSHLKENLAATFAPAVTAGLELLTKLLTSEPKGTIYQQIANLKNEVIDLNKEAGKLLANKSFMQLLAFGPESEGGGGATGTGKNKAVESIQAQIRELEALAKAQEQSKEYNDALDKGNAEAERNKKLAAAAAAEARKKANEEAIAEAKRIQKENEKILKQYDEFLFKFEKFADKASALKSINLAATLNWPAGFFEDQMKSLKAQEDFNKAMKDAEKLEGPKRAAAAIRLFVESKRDVVDMLEAFKSLGGDSSLKLSENLQLATKNFKALRETANATTNDVDVAWNKVLQAQLQIGQESEKTLRTRLSLEIQLAELTGASAEAQIKQLVDLNNHTLALKISTETLGNVYASINKDFLNVFDNLDKGLVKLITSGGSIVGMLKGIGKSLEEDIVGSFVHGITEGLKAAFINSGAAKAVNDFFSGIFKDLFGGLFKSVTAAPTVAAQTANTSALTANTAALTALTSSISAQGAASAAAGAGGGLGGVTSGLGGLLNTITGAVSAISSVIGNFQMAGMNKSLDVIVKHTLETTNELRNLRSDEWLREDYLFHKLDDMWNEIRNVVEILRLMGQVGMGGGSDGLGDQIADAINSRPHSTGNSNDVEEGLGSLAESLRAGVDAADIYTNALQTTASTAYSLDEAVSSTTSSLYALNEATKQVNGALPGFVDGMDRAIFNSMTTSPGQPGQNLTPNGARSNITPYIMPVPVPDALTGPGGLMQGAMMGHSNSQISYPTIAPVVGGPGVTRGGQQALVTVYAVDPSGRQVANATIQGLEERGIRVR